MRPPAKLTNDDATALAAACTTCPDLATIRDLAQGFTSLVRERGGKHLSTWVELARNGSFPAISTFANGLRKDWNAVTAGLTTTWSSGAVEGNVNRIKMIKRQMYGRANTDLLRRRIILGN
jgi:transposase